MPLPAARRRLSRGVVVLLLAGALAACGGAIPAAPPHASPGAGSVAPPAAGAIVTRPPAPATATTLPPRPGPPGTGTPGAATPPPTPTTVAAHPTSAATTGGAAVPTATSSPRAGLPVRVRIPRIGVDAAVEHVGLAPDGAMDVPKDYGNTAWYRLGPRPGEQGNAAVAGHVDSRTGPAVFWNLPRLRPGDEIFVAGDDGTERRFVVQAVEAYKRTDAPLDRIFGPATDRRLNLITCDPESTFNRATGEYAANIVVYTEFAP